MKQNWNVTPKEVIEIVKKCIIKHRLPETTRFAHNKVNEYRIADNIKFKETNSR